MVPKYLSTFFDFLIYSNIYLALCGVFCAYGVTLQFGLPFTFSLAAVEFSAIISLYSLNRYMELKQDLKTYPTRTSFIRNKIHLFIVATIFFYISALIFSLLQNMSSFLLIIFFTFLMIVYGLRIGNFRLKDILLVKNIYVGIVWTLLLVIFPQIFFQTMILSKTIPYIILIGLLCAIDTIIFDLRDIRGDKENKIQTIPVVFGSANVKKFLYSITVLMLLFSAVLSVYVGKEYITFILTILYMLFVISRIDVEDIKIVSEIYADAFPAFFGFFSIVLHLVFV